jgi:hypothetical protein
MEAKNARVQWGNARASSLFYLFEEQEIAILSLHLLQICLVYINTLLVQKVLSEKEWLEKMQPEDFRGLTPLFYGHVNPYGRLVLGYE